ncbi:UNVERIFIED_CONTAM: hypothetical protein PYX00_006102 [Menopon gallinae]|uniref:Uncharacterized protein n=1 Tax=Menopon gallinae TaxID=328185 RepID=A0AAW2HUA3_9NEOP
MIIRRTSTKRSTKRKWTRMKIYSTPSSPSPPKITMSVSTTSAVFYLLSFIPLGSESILCIT